MPSAKGRTAAIVSSRALTAGSPAGSFACVGSVDQHLACLHIVLKIQFQYLDRTHPVVLEPCCSPLALLGCSPEDNHGHQ